jgi:hypothetical protein
MKKYRIHYTPEVLEDMDNVYHYIAGELMSPDTAVNYRNGIYDAIQRLAIAGGAIAISQRDYLQRRYGAGAYRYLQENDCYFQHYRRCRVYPACDSR